MRRAVLKGVHELARRDPRVVFVGSDISKRDLEGMAKEYPDRFLMEGVSEGHLIGLAAGLAFEGKIPYLNTIATFLTRRCFEQIVIDLCLHKLPVRLIGSGGGTVYAPLGPTHLATEDMSILRALPHMTIVVPSDAEEMKRFMPESLEWPGPIYIRLAKGGDKVIPSGGRPFRIGEAVPLREGEDALLVATGATTAIALDAAQLLEGRGVRTAVLHMHPIKPLDEKALLERASRARAVVAVEEGTVFGGLGGAVAEVLAEARLPRPLRFARMGLPDSFLEHYGSQAQIMGHYGITPEGIGARVLELLEPGTR
jgi:transketolase